MIRTALCACLLVFALPATALANPPTLSKCNLNGTANQQIGCLDNDNAAKLAVLKSAYSKRLESFYSECEQQFQGGGSGGHEDRATCVASRIEQEAVRVGISLAPRPH